MDSTKYIGYLALEIADTMWLSGLMSSCGSVIR